MYKLVVIDIDDTLLNDNGMISARTKAALNKAQEQNVTIALATGRMFVSAKKIADQIGGKIPLITYQGALIKESNGNVLSERIMPSEVIEKVIDYCQAWNYHLQMYSGDKLLVKEKNEKVEFYTKMHSVSFNIEPNFHQFIEKPVNKMVIFEKEFIIDQIQTELSKAIGENCYITKSKPYFLEILNTNATKANAIRILCDHLGYDLSNVIGIGDGWNDIGLLKNVGLPVAMGNAVEDLKKIAKVITSSNNEDGVGKVIETYVLKD
jgi:Cof subfamily protein (haloacid dehalogenase superfamily)